jgi:hypothetical protein
MNNHQTLPREQLADAKRPVSTFLNSPDDKMAAKLPGFMEILK